MKEKIILGSNLEKKWRLLNFDVETAKGRTATFILNSPNRYSVGRNKICAVNNGTVYVLK